MNFLLPQPKEIRTINLSLSNRCNAKCIWCPTSRGTKHNYDMPPELAYKIIDEISSPDFPYEVDGINVSENGEPFYNKNAIDILRHIKKKIPTSKVLCLSNFGLLGRKVTEIICKEKLLTSVGVNFDGHDEESYHNVKKIPFKSVLKNFLYFIEMREKYYPDLHVGINVMPAVEYSQTVKEFFGANPDQVDDLSKLKYSNRDLVEETLRKHLPDDIVVRASKPGLWAERKHILAGRKGHFQRKDLVCPMFERVEHEIYVAPNGDWYACCLDDNNDAVFGNLNDQSIVEINQSTRRRKFINDLKNKRFESAGYPCNTVEACQIISMTRN